MDSASQRTGSTDSSAANVVYVELAGSGVLLTLNYERLITQHLALRAGICAIPVAVVSIPLTVSWFLGSEARHLELGAGIVFLPVSVLKIGKSGDLKTAIIGYRYQPRSGGFVFRIAFTPLYDSSEKIVKGGAGLSLGFTF